MPNPIAWLASPAEATDVARLLIAFRDHYGRDWPSDDEFLAGAVRLLDDEDTEFILAAVDAERTGHRHRPAALPLGHLA